MPILQESETIGLGLWQAQGAPHSGLSTLSPAGPLGFTGSAGGRWGCLGPKILPKPWHSLHPR